ncbi:MAG: MarR family transcriptional regulator [Oscillospiraceae bacterium]|nr:MarR family transcriptional regulator [Oscillospiraceae bacterium]
MEDKKKELIEMLHRLNISERYIIDRLLEEKGIYFGQPPILHFLNQNPNATQKEIADFLNVSPASVAVSVKRMEKSGIISRATDKDDARRNNLSLTEKGKELECFARQTFKTVDSAKLSNLSSEELEAMLAVIKKMNDNLMGLFPEKCKKHFKCKEEKDV